MTTYTMPPEPDCDTLWDSHGIKWQRNDNKWESDADGPIVWSELVYYYGPLTTLSPLEAGIVIKNEDHLTNVKITPGTVIESADGYLVVFDGIDAWRKFPSTDCLVFTTDPFVWIEYPCKVLRVGWPAADRPLLPVEGDAK